MGIEFSFWIIMAVGAQFIWAGGNYLDNFLLKRYRQTTDHGGPGTIIFISVMTAAFVAVGTILVSFILTHVGYHGSTNLHLTPLEALKGLTVGVVQVSWMITYLYALDESDETEAVPLFQSVPVFALVLGVSVFDEIPTAAAVLGSLIIVAGGLLLNFHLGTMKLNKSVIALMLTSSFLVALAAFMFKNNAEDTNFLSSLFWMKTGIVLTGLAVWFAVPSYRRQFTCVLKNRDWSGLGINLVNELCDRLARIIFFGAIMLGPSVMSVQATTAYQPIFIFLIGLLLARNGSAFHAERYKKSELIKKGIGVALITLGSYFIFT